MDPRWLSTARPKHERLSDANIAALFHKFSSGDELKKEDLERVLEQLHLPHWCVERAWNSCDRDHSGKVSMEEFTEFIHHQEDSIAATFAEIDVNNDGTLDRQEIDKWLHEHGVRASAEDELKLMEHFHASDSITYAQFRDTMMFLNPTDLALFADDWMHYGSVDDLGTSHVGDHPETTATGAKAGAKAGAKQAPTWLKGVAGGTSAAISRTCVAPLERLRFQMITDGAKYGGSTAACLRSIVNEEGVAALWKGNGVNMIRIIPQNSLMFFAKPAIAASLKSTVSDPFYAGMLSGMVAGCVSASAIYPLDVVRLRITTTPGVYKGVLDGFRTIVAKEGFPALFKGIAYANLWAIPYTGALFATADFLKAQYSSRSGKKPTPLVGVGVGAAAGAVSTFVGFPLESARRKMQAQGTGGRPVLYANITECIAGTVKQGGVGALYQGCVANIIKMAPAQAITFGCMQVIVPTLTGMLPP